MMSRWIGVTGVLALGLSIVVAGDANADVIEQYTAKLFTGTGGPTVQYATLDNSTPNPPAPNQTDGSYTNTWSGGNLSLNGQSVYLPLPNQLDYVGSSFSGISFSYYTGGLTTGTTAGSLPIAYAPAGTTLYVFETVGNPTVTAGQYTGSPTSPSLSSSTAGVIGYSTVTDTLDGLYKTFIKTGGGDLSLSAGNTYYFYLGGPTSSTPAYSFDNSDGTAFSGTGTDPYTPYSTGVAPTTGYNGDQRYRTAGSPTPTYQGPLNSMTLFSLYGTVVPEPSRVAGLIGLGIMGAVALCFARFAKRKAVSR